MDLSMRASDKGPRPYMAMHAPLATFQVYFSMCHPLFSVEIVSFAFYSSHMI